MSDIYDGEEITVTCACCGNQSDKSFTRMYEDSTGPICEMCVVLRIEKSELAECGELFHRASVVSEAINYLNRKKAGSAEQLFPSVVAFLK